MKHILFGFAVLVFSVACAQNPKAGNPAAQGATDARTQVGAAHSASQAAVAAAELAPLPPPKLRLRLSRTVHGTQSMRFLSHRGDGPFANYLTVEVPFEPVKALLADLEKQLGQTLVSRGEAHITVITPLEYNEILKAYVPIAEIERIAHENAIQSAKFEVVCLGRAQAIVAGRYEQAYYLVLRSEALLKIREAIFKAYTAAGGEASRFDPRTYYPHITVGFSKTDLHEGSGVKKGANSCVAPIVLM